MRPKQLNETKKLRQWSMVEDPAEAVMESHPNYWKTTVMSVHFETISTTDGPFSLLELDGVVLCSGWTGQLDELLLRSPIGKISEPPTPGKTTAGQAVRDYYAGQLDAIDSVKVSLRGTEFQIAGWNQLRNIPAGSTLSYSEFAAATGRPRAVRAAASICAKNVVPLFVPCHRICRSDGSLGDFAWGSTLKNNLLRHEGAF